MLSNYLRAHPSPHIEDLNPLPALNTDEAQRAANVFGIAAARVRRAPRRSDLPDVDFSRVERVRSPSFLRRLAEELGLASRRYVVRPEEWRVLQPSRPIPAEPQERRVVPFHNAA